MRALIVYATVLAVAFYGMLFDMSMHLDGWRVAEPVAFLVVIVVMSGLGRVIFGDGDAAE